MREEEAFAEVVEMIQAARGQAMAVVNTALIDLYWKIDEYIWCKLETAAWGATSVSSGARCRSRSAARTSRSTCCSFTVALPAWLKWSSKQASSNLSTSGS